MSNGFDAPARVQLRSSTALAAALSAGHGLAALAALAIPIPLAARCVLCAALCASLARALAVHALRRTRACVSALQLDADGTLWLCRGGTWHRARIRQAVVSSRLIVMRLVRHGGVVVAGDSADARELRRFRAALRLRNWSEPGWYRRRTARGPDSRA